MIGVIKEYLILYHYVRIRLFVWLFEFYSIAYWVECSPMVWETKVSCHTKNFKNGT